ncbi:cytochrome c biogenesis CcdA family protein [Petrotoga sp. 9PWA.NaAc.5.4]|uniref:cytochrome c biogenesis CcdA family protein n=1 Tax=Petrotoga sp. 9PWA.NaAc.5.4 TaxID=1434328 RepID=UPI000CA6AD0C|nr:cytochrome c biogenesis CcdA family protein [Petrotoga sp. 9PWA.NaAc.5.4]PNR94807.1 cytochrome C biogenesis protein [Petrotoga sp. 9PWA.NaAc.5.4]
MESLSFSTSVSFITALFGGIISFFSPCVLPLIPVFFGIVIPDISNTRLVIKRGVGFFIGLSLFFSFLGSLSGALGMILARYQILINIIAGILIIFFGLLYIFNIRLFTTQKIDLKRYNKSSSFFSTFLLGILIALIWIPCASPVLASILTLATTTGNAVRGALLLFVYSLGISIPFLFLSGIVSKIVSKVTIGEPKWEKSLRIVGGMLLIVVGVVISFGFFNNLQGGF